MREVTMTAEPATGPRPRAVRLTFSFNDDVVQLAERRPVEAIAPPTDPVSGHTGQAGAWIELRSSDAQTRYRRVMDDPFRQDAEVFSPDPVQSIARAPQARRSGTFSVLVPDSVDTDHVVVFSSAAPQAARARAATGSHAAVEVARFSLP
jgi:hypothetical protein